MSLPPKEEEHSGCRWTPKAFIQQPLRLGLEEAAKHPAQPEGHSGQHGGELESTSSTKSAVVMHQPATSGPPTHHRNSSASKEGAAA